MDFPMEGHIYNGVCFSVWEGILLGMALNQNSA